MNHDEATRYFDELGAAADSRPPVSDLVIAGRNAERRKRRRTIVASAAAVALILGGGAVVQQATAGGDGEPAPTEVTDPPEAPDGMRLVGMGRAVMAVPESWTQDQNGCTTSTSGNVYFPPVPPRSCYAPNISSPESMQPTLGISELTLGPSALDKFEALAGSAGAVAEPGLCLESKPSSCSQRIAVSSEGVLFTLSWWRTDEGEATAAQVRDSVQLLPDGYTTVPYLPSDLLSGPAGNLLIDAGLEFVEKPAPGAPTGRAAQFGTVPGAGSVVAVGATLTLQLEPGSTCPPGQAREDPEDPDAVPTGPDYPVNEGGMTYGGASGGNYPDPDLIAVYGNCGQSGYAVREDLDDPAPWSPDAGLAGTPRTIPVYASDGVTQIDTFTIGVAEGSTSDTDTANPTGPDAEDVQGKWAVTIAGIQREDGTQQFDTYRDLNLTAAVRGNTLRLWDGCQSSTATLALSDGDFSLIQGFQADAPMPEAGCERQAPLVDIVQNIRHVTVQGGDVYLHLGNFQIALVLRRGSP